MDLLKIYNFGVKFLEENPKLAEWHNQLKKCIIQSYKKENLIQLCQSRRRNKSDDAIKCSIALQFCLFLLFSFFGLSQLIIHFSLFKFTFDIIIAFVFYLYGTLNTESLKYPELSAGEQAAEVKMPEAKPIEIKPQKTPEPPKEVKKEKTLFWRIYGYVNTLCAWGWVYFSLMHPDALKKWLIQSGIMDYIPHEQGVENTWNETYLLFGGVVLISIAFSIIKVILRAVFWISKNLFPKRDVREL